MADNTDMAKRGLGEPPPRAWWQWVVGIGLLCGAAALLVARYVPGLWPTGPVPYVIAPRGISVSAEMKRADSIPAAPGEFAGCNVLLVTLDTTRADRIGCYGNTEIETPTLDRLAREGVLFSNAIVAAPTTLPSHASILTGLQPHRHGARSNGLFRMGDEHVTLAEALSDRGYATGAVISAFVLAARFGVAQGFSEYDDDLSDVPEPERFRARERPADQTTDRAIAWVREHRGEPFFLWVHYFDPHAEYRPPSPYAERYKKLPYDGEIAFVDAEFARLVGTLDDLDLSSRTLVVVVGDHGEGLGQHDEWTHGALAYESTLRVPFILWCGQRLGGGLHIDRLVSAVDVVPTVLSLLGVEQTVQTDGVDLTRPMVEPRFVAFETFEGLFAHGWAPLAGARFGDLKYIHGPRPELYDLSNDPFEENDLIKSRADVAAELRERLATVYGGDLEAALVSQPSRGLSADELQQLGALGYVMAGVGSEGPLPDPRDMIELGHRAEIAMGSIARTGLDAAIETLEKLHREHPDFYLAPLFLADCHIRKGEFEQAEEALTACLRILPNHANAMLTLAQVKLQRGDVEGAVALHRKLLSVVPDHVGAMAQCGLLLLQTEQATEAADLLERAFLLEPRDQMITDGLVAAMLVADRAQEAQALLAARLEADPRLVAVRSSLAGLLAQQERYGEAIALLQEGREKMPQRHELASHLALLLATCPDEDIRAPLRAAVIIERVCEETEYNDPRFLLTLAVVYGTLQRMEEAIAYTERGLGLASAPEQWQLKQQIAAQLAYFKAARDQGVAPNSKAPVAPGGASPGEPEPDDPQ